MKPLRVLILTSSRSGTAAHHLPILVASGRCEVAMVIYARSVVKDRRKLLLRKIRKIFSIGIFGALNGIRMRKWYEVPTEDLGSLCHRMNIPFATTDRINDERTKELMRAVSADLGISLGNGYIAKSVFSIPERGMINIHHEILPEYQNAQAVIWQLYNGSRETGYTIHRIDERIDTGAIIHQGKVPIQFKDELADTVRSTYHALLEASAKGLAQVIGHFDELDRNARPQGKGTRYTTPDLKHFRQIVREHDRLRRK